MPSANNEVVGVGCFLIQMSIKRKPENEFPVTEEEDILKITPLGAGNEVGRSCILIEFKGKKIMVS
jgi:cleavage and polyadenylation specificity factor subunit 3